MHRSVMAPAKKYQVVERRGAAIGPMSNVMRVAAACRASRKTAAGVPGGECPPDRGRNRPGLAADIQYGAVGPRSHDDDRGVAGETAGRFRGNVDGAVAEFQVQSGRSRPPHRRRAAPPDSGPPLRSVEVGLERAFGEQAQRIGPTLLGGDFLFHGLPWRRLFRLLIETLGRRLERPLHDRSQLRRQPGTQHHHPVVVDPVVSDRLRCARSTSRASFTRSHRRHARTTRST